MTAGLLLQWTVGILVISVAIGLAVFALAQARYDSRWLWPWRAFGYLAVACVVVIDLGRLGLPPWQQAAGALMAMMLLFVFSTNYTRRGDPWPRSYRWRREVDRAMGQERAGRRGAGKSVAREIKPDDRRGIF